MNDNPVKFEEETILVDRASQISRQSAFTSLILRLGLAKNETQANYVLIGTIVCCLLATLFIVSKYLI
jgi:hypothetical protein